MMATTHAMVGMSLALPVFALAPELAPVAVVAGLVGGTFPDLDLYAGHRRTLHYPVYSALLAVPAIGLALLSPSAVTVSLAVGLAAAAAHAGSDVLGGGLELKPWRGTSDRAVYSHFHGRWIRPRRWVRYDGAPEDLAIASVVALPLLATVDGTAQLLVVALLGVSMVYVLLRRSLAALVERLVAVLPAPILPYVPERYTDVVPVDRTGPPGRSVGRTR